MMTKNDLERVFNNNAMKKRYVDQLVIEMKHNFTFHRQHFSVCYTRDVAIEPI